MEEESGEFHEWEILQNSDTGSVRSPEFLREIDEYNQSFIRSDYFALDSETRGTGRVDYEGSEGSDSQKLGYSDVKEEFGVSGDNSEGELGVEEIQGIAVEINDSEEIMDFEGNQGHFVEDDLRNEVGFEETQSENKSDSSENELLLDSGGGGGDDDLGVENSDHRVSEGTQFSSESSGVGAVVEEAIEELKSGEEVKKEMVWWKLPFELFKFCIFRVSPLWTFSVAAAVLGFVLLRRRLYKMKRKSRSLPVKLSFEDKKVSRFNEAISVVRRVPIIRHSLPAAGLSPWPMVSMR